jgi:hypothetical protein
MNIEGIFIKKVTLDDDFNYKMLYNDSRGAVFKDEYKALLREAISKKVITVEKFVIAENIQDELYNLSETKGPKYTLIECLKNYHQESDYLIAPFIYILKKLDGDFKLSDKEGEFIINSNLFEVDIRPRIDRKNAEPRIFFPKEKIAISSTNDNVENLVDILAVRDVQIYIIGTENRSNIIYAYKVSRSDRFFDVAKGYIDSLRPELSDRVKKYEI